jgi:electron transfer flavoprotein beta subunit
VVLVKQVTDSEAPASAYGVDATGTRVVLQHGVPFIVNGFDENAVEAALRIKDAAPGTQITIVSAGADFALDVVKKPIAMGADALVLLQDAYFENSIDSTFTVQALAAAVRKLGQVDLVLAGRQASDWDNAQVPLGVAEALDWPVIHVTQRVEVHGKVVRAWRVLPDGYEVVEADLPAVVTVSNELGTPRYPNMRGIMASKRVQPAIWSAADLGLQKRALVLELTRVELPQRSRQTEMITGEDDADAGRKLALRLREAKVL